ncbi:MAG: hypothetical protein R6U50_15160 [Desulfobacterales bacterium]
MNDNPTLSDLESRWKNALSATQSAVRRHPEVYSQIKSLAHRIITQPLDINDYFSTAQKLSHLLEAMDPDNKGSIFFYFNRRIRPSTVRQVPFLRMECRDLLAHLSEFDDWRRKSHRLKIIS